MNNQEVYDKTVAHLRKQGCKSETEDGDVYQRCMYLNPKTGHKCAVGCHIKPEHYKPDFEHKPLDNPDLWAALVLSGIEMDNRKVLYDLQYIHDTTYVTYWEDEFKTLAIKFGLVYTAP